MTSARRTITTGTAPNYIEVDLYSESLIFTGMDTDVSRLVGAVARRIETVDRDGQPARLLVADRAYDTTIEDLWDALTNVERVPRWFLPVSGELKVGGRFQFEGNAGGEILACQPPRSFEVTWEYGGDVSWVTVELTPEPDGLGTRLELRQLACGPEDMWDQFGPGAVGVGWELGMMGLDRHLSADPGDTAGDQSVDPAEAVAWMASDEGHAFVAQVSDGWCTASIQAGTALESAIAAAERTTAAYTAGEPSE